MQNFNIVDCLCSCAGWIEPYLGTANTIIFGRNVFSRIAFRDIFATLKIRDYGMIYLYQKIRVISPFRKGNILHETSHMRSFAKMKPSRSFRIYIINLKEFSSWGPNSTIPTSIQSPATIGTPAKRHWNGVSPADRSRPFFVCLLGLYSPVCRYVINVMYIRLEN